MITSLLLTLLSPSAATAAPPVIATKEDLASSRRLVDWDYDGERILGHDGNEVVAWDARTGRVLQRFKGHRERIRFVRLAPDRKHVLTSAWIRSDPGGRLPREVSTRLWSLATGQETARLDGVVATDLSPDGRMVAGFRQREGNRYEPVVATISRPASVTALPGLGDVRPAFGDVRFTDGGRTVAVTHASAFGLYETRSGRRVGKESGTSPLQFFSPHGLVAVGSSSAEVLDVRTQAVKQRIPLPPSAAIEIGAAHGDRLVLGSARGPLGAWNLRTGQPLPTPRIDGRPQSISFSPDGKVIAVEYTPGDEMPPVKLVLYRTDTGAEIATLPLPDWDRLIGFSPDGRTLLIGGPAFLVVDAQSGKVTRRLNLLGDRVDSFGWTTGGRIN